MRLCQLLLWCEAKKKVLGNHATVEVEYTWPSGKAADPFVPTKPVANLGADGTLDQTPVMTPPMNVRLPVGRRHAGQEDQGQHRRDPAGERQ